MRGRLAVLAVVAAGAGVPGTADAAAAAGAVATAPAACSKACTSAAASPAASSTAMGAPTSTSWPAGTSHWPITPALSALISTMALSVSTSARQSPAAIGSPSFFDHAAKVAWVALAATSGIRSKVAM